MKQPVFISFIIVTAKYKLGNSVKKKSSDVDNHFNKMKNYLAHLQFEKLGHLAKAQLMSCSIFNLDY